MYDLLNVVYKVYSSIRDTFKNVLRVSKAGTY